MDSVDIDTVVNLLIEELAPPPVCPGGVDGGGGRRLYEVFAAPRRDDEPRLAAVLTAVVALRNLLDAVMAGAANAVERLGVGAGAESLTRLGVAPAVAYRAMRVGRAAPGIPALARAARVGGVGLEAADAICAGIAHIQARVAIDETERARITTALMVEASPAAITRKARGLAIALTPDHPTPAGVPVAEDAALNDMTLSQTRDGRVQARMDLDVHTGEELHAALDALCRPSPAPDGSPDPRTAGQRRADGFGQLLRSYLSGQSRPTSGGVLPHITLIRPASAGAAAGNPDALVAELGAVAGPGAFPGIGSAVDTLGFCGPVTTTTAELISCDAAVTAVYVDACGAPLDVGRTQRLFPPKIRKALAARDCGCAFPGCGRPVSWTDAHHIRPWAAGGTTSVDNGVLLCRRHHRMIHHDGWQVYLGPDRHPWFIPPVDPAHPTRAPEHLRCHARRTLTALPTAA